jgi:hypothetical protein
MTIQVGLIRAPPAYTSILTLPGTGSCDGLMAAAPNGGAVLCGTSGADGGEGFEVVTTGATPTTFALPVPSFYPYGPFPFFLPDSTIAWMNGTTFFSEPVLGGLALTLASSVNINNYLPIGGSQVAVVGTGPSSPVFIADAAGKVPTFELLPNPDVQPGVFAPPGGGLVAYSSDGVIYAVRTN